MVVNNPDKIYFHYLNEPFGPYWEMIKPSLELRKVRLNSFVENYRYSRIGRKRLSYAHHADFIRIEKLLEYGGVYADIDTLFVKPYPKQLFEKPFVLGREPDIVSETTGRTESSLCNALIFSEKNSSFGNRWLQSMKDHFDGSWSNHSTLLPDKLSRKHPGEIHIEPQRSFYRFIWNSHDLNELLKRKTNDRLDGVYSIHLWEHTWVPKWKDDYTDFHGKLLTEDYVNSGSTTFSQLACRFLPTPGERKRVRPASVLFRVLKLSEKNALEIKTFLTRIFAKIQYLLNS